ncbi:SMI1/KNR4 family protein [Mariniblastus sp.]|nr:SMI1/KNR4 family protein [Mariniblastus sp.]
MPNWKKAVEQFFAKSDPNGEFYHCAEDGLSAKDITSVLKKLKMQVPDELRDFYGQFNGLGLTNDETEFPNFIPPIEYLSDLVIAARTAFPKSHKTYADRYLSVVNWENGDTCGYVMKEDGSFVDCFFMFNHELCSHEKSQDVNEFLTPVAENLYSFLSE